MLPRHGALFPACGAARRPASALSSLRLRIHFARDQLQQLALTGGPTGAGSSGRQSAASGLDDDDDGYVPFVG